MTPIRRRVNFIILLITFSASSLLLACWFKALMVFTSTAKSTIIFYGNKMAPAESSIKSQSSQQAQMLLQETAAAAISSDHVVSAATYEEEKVRMEASSMTTSSTFNFLPNFLPRRQQLISNDQVGKDDDDAEVNSGYYSSAMKAGALQHRNKIVSSNTQPNGQDTTFLMEMTLKARRKLLQKHCRQPGFSGGGNSAASAAAALSISSISEDASFNFIFVDDAHKTVFCSAPKVASTSLRQFFVVLNAQNGDGDDGVSIDNKHLPAADKVHDLKFMIRHGLKPLSAYSPSEAIERIGTYKKFMITRHPIDRLVSAWRSKLTNATDAFRSTFYKAKRRQILDILMAAKDEKELQSPTRNIENAISTDRAITLGEFFEYLVIDATPHRFESGITTSGNNRADIHWLPINQVCKACLIQYDDIIHYEELSSEFNFVTKFRLHISTMVLPPSMSKTQHFSSFMDELKANGIKADDALMSKVIQRYRHDFDLFGYDIDHRNWI